MPSSQPARRITVPAAPWPLEYIVGLVPAAYFFWAALTGGAGADPIAWLEHELGQWALIFLIASLCVTPIRQIAGINFIRYRRALGLTAFYYVVLHLGTWFFLDIGRDFQAAFRDILRRPYITIGMIALVLLIPLALTSNTWSIRKLGGKGWQTLHKLVYVAVPLGAIHYIMVKKVWMPKPMVFAAIVAILLIWRFWRRIGDKNSKAAKRPASA